MILVDATLFIYIFTINAFVRGKLILNKTVTSENWKILNGRDTEDGEFPYQVCLGEMNGHFCGGALVDECHVLTAAHCLEGFIDKFENLRIMVGDIDLNGEGANRQVTEIEQMYLHEEYTQKKEKNDIALIRTKTNLIENDGVRPIALRSEAITEGQCVATGWGALKPVFRKETDIYPTILQAIEIPFISTEKCQKLYEESSEEKITPGMICAGLPNEGKDTCLGDSGGPLVCDGQLTGLTSWGEECGNPNVPGVYADIVYYKDWIRNIIKESKCDNRA